MSNVVNLNRERASRIVSAEQDEREARRKLAEWIDDNARLGTDFLIESLRSAISAVETFEDMIKE